VIAQLIAPLGHHAVGCRTLRDLVAELDDDATAAVLTEESLNDDAAPSLREWIQAQPPWSDFPFVVLATRQRGARPSEVSAVLDSLGNQVLLERPLNADTLVSAINSAVRSRYRQYQARGQLEQQREVGIENRRLYEAEKKARAEAEAASRAKEDFLATLSHELRTPLSAILGWTYVLKKRRAELGDLAKGVETIERNAKAQARLIEDLLDMSRIVADKVSLEYQTVVPAHLLEQVIASVLPQSQARKITIEQSLTGGLVPMQADPQRLQQVVWNLLSNAIKFTADGGTVCVAAELKAGEMVIRVSDNGIGIPAELLPVVFERFRQADGSTTRSHGGLGLGLAIANRLVELHGGRIEATSGGPGKGSTFTIYLPMTNETDAVASPSPGKVVDSQASGNISIDDIKVLLVEDDRDGREMIAQLLADSGGQVQAVASAEQALAALDGGSFDIVVSDIGMPETDGFQLLERIRAAGNQIPAIALTAFARLEDRDKALHGGYALHLSKPVEPPVLIAAVAQIVKRQGNDLRS